MAQLILIDTDILIDAGRKVGEAIACLERVEQQATLGVSIITQMELILTVRSNFEGFQTLWEGLGRRGGTTWPRP